MSWHAAYLIIRVSNLGQAEIVHTSHLIKDARYWLQYIAMPGDAIFLSSRHPKYSGDGKPKYFAHLITRGQIAYDEKIWLSQIRKEVSEICFGENLEMPS